MPKEKSFESSLNDLERIVEQLEAGDMSLEDSLKLFEQGIKLSRDCQKRLDEAERRVEVLLKNNDGTYKTENFEEPEV